MEEDKIKSSLKNKITTFKFLGISKIVYLALLTIVPKNNIKEMNEIQENFVWSNKNLKLNMVHCVMITKIKVWKM